MTRFLGSCRGCAAIEGALRLSVQGAALKCSVFRKKQVPEEGSLNSNFQSRRRKQLGIFSRGATAFARV